MRPSQFISILAYVCAVACGLALITLTYDYASKFAGAWIILYYTFLIIDEYEQKNEDQG